MEGPYREPRPLADIIPPDRRRQKTIALVVVSMLAGAVLLELGRRALQAEDEARSSPSPVLANPNVIERVTLSGPDGAVTIPNGTSKMVLHVWLQGCQDCMPAFEAMRDLEARGGLGVGVPVVNVSYGEADPAWAARYGVRTNLVYDERGSAVVRRVGVNTFTTLVIDERGKILRSDRPDRPGYAARVRDAVGPAAAPPIAPSEPERDALDAAAIERVVRAHGAGVRRACWERHDEEVKSARVTVKVVVASDGRVASAEATGTDAVVAQCVETQMRTWLFPAHKERSATIQVPFTFARQ